jgi:tetratricopeptide (TPR) repeat protein
MRIESLRDLHGQFPDIDGFWDFADLNRTESNIRARLPSEEGPWTPKDLEALTQLGRLQGLQGNLSQARATLEKARQRINEISGEARLRPETRVLLELGRVLCLGMTPTKAQNFFNEAWELATASHDAFFAIDAALMLSISQPPKSKNEWLQKAMMLAQETKAGQGKLWLAQLYTMEGWHAFDFRQFDKALESFEKALAEPRQPGDEKKYFVNRWCRARALRAVNRNQEAYEIQQTLLGESTEAGSNNGHVYLEVAECLQALNRHEEAKAFFESAHKELSADGWYSDNKASELGRMMYLAKKR